MPITVSGTSITFNDATVQTTAAGGAPTTAQVLTATAGASVGAVGTYAFLSTVVNNTSAITAGNTFAGSDLRYFGATVNANEGQSLSSAAFGTAPSGTWRAMGTSNKVVGFPAFGITLFLRIS
jgi:hypothetical protein